MGIPPAASDVWGAVRGDGGCLLPPRGAGHGALGAALGRIRPTPLARGTAAPVARAGLPGTAKTPACGRDQPCRHLSLSLLQRGSCPETQRCLRPGGAGVPSPPARAFRRGLAPRTPDTQARLPSSPQPGAAGTGTALCPATGHGHRTRCCPSMSRHPAHPTSSRGSMWHGHPHQQAPPAPPARYCPVRHCSVASTWLGMLSQAEANSPVP